MEEKEEQEEKKKKKKDLKKGCTEVQGKKWERE